MITAMCRSTIHLGQSKKKRMRNRVSCAKVELPHNSLTKGDHISHEQEYNTGHGIPAISHEVRRKIRRQPRQSEIQQEPVVHLLLEAALGWKCGIPCLSVQAASRPSKPAYGSRTETHPGHARRNPTLGMIELWHRLRQRDYTRCPESLFRVMRKMGLFPAEKPKNTYKPKPYEQMTHPGKRIQVNVKVVPRSCITNPDLRRDHPKNCVNHQASVE